MAYKVKISTRFKKDFKRCMKRGLDMTLIMTAMDLLEATGSLPAEYKPHQLKGNQNGQWECHIEPNWIMPWEQKDTELSKKSILFEQKI
jgi:mRNA interferase YafQ